MIVNNAIKLLIQKLSTLSYQIAIGTGTTPPWVDNLTLEKEYARADATVEIETTKITGDTLKLSATFTLSEAVSISEFGVFEKETGIMICRQVIAPVELPVSTPLNVIFHIQAIRT
jgi:hypothetical protein